MLLHREDFNPVTNQSDIIGYWESLIPEDVKTPVEIYASLKAEGYNIDYDRVPLTRERAPLATDVDAIQRRLDEYVLSFSLRFTFEFEQYLRA